MKRLNVKRTYIFSYVAVILLALVMAGAALIGYGMNALKETMTYEQMEHARLAAADLKTQMDGFLQIRNRMKTNYLFQPAYQRRAYTRRLEMINALSGYDSYLLTDAQLYLMYGSDGEIYFDQTCTDWESLCRLYWGIEPDAFLHDLVCGDESVLLRSEALQGDLIEVLPFELGPSGNRERMTLFFRIRTDDVYARLAKVSGLKRGEFSATLDGQLILGKEEMGWRTVASEDGIVRIGLSGISGEAYARLSQTQSVLFWLCVGFCVLSIGTAVWMAIRQYRPIGVIHRRLGGGDGNELAFIEQTITDTLRENDRVKRDIVSQMDSLITQSEVIEHQAEQLRRQLVLLLLLGVYRTEQEVPDELLMMFRKPRFAVLSLRGEDSDVDPSRVERCVSERWSLFAVPIARQNRIAVLANLTDRGDLFELVTQLGKKLGGNIEVFSGEIVDLMHVSVSFLQSSDGRKALEGGEERNVLTGTQCRELFMAVRMGNVDKAMACVTELCESLPKNVPMLDLRRIHLALLRKLRNLADEMNCTIDDGHATALMLSMTVEQFAENLKSCICDLMEEGREDEAAAEASQVDRLIAYLDENACDPDMSLVRIENEFQMSRKRITAIVKQQTGMGFREYIVYRRIERAKLLLANTKLSVTTISEMCGYDSPSYFNKSFKSMTDMTPGQYQKDAE